MCKEDDSILPKKQNTDKLRIIICWHQVMTDHDDTPVNMVQSNSALLTDLQSNLGSLFLKITHEQKKMFSIF